MKYLPPELIKLILEFVPIKNLKNAFQASPIFCVYNKKGLQNRKLKDCQEKVNIKLGSILNCSIEERNYVIDKAYQAMIYMNKDQEHYYTSISHPSKILSHSYLFTASSDFEAVHKVYQHLLNDYNVQHFYIYCEEIVPYTTETTTTTLKEFILNDIEKAINYYEITKLGLSNVSEHT